MVRHWVSVVVEGAEGLDSKSEFSLKPIQTIQISNMTLSGEEEEKVVDEEAGESPMLEKALEVASLLNYRDCAHPWVKTYLPMERKDQQIK